MKLKIKNGRAVQAAEHSPKGPMPPRKPTKVFPGSGTLKSDLDELKKLADKIAKGELDPPYPKDVGKLLQQIQKAVASGQQPQAKAAYDKLYKKNPSLTYLIPSNVHNAIHT